VEPAEETEACGGGAAAATSSFLLSGLCAEKTSSLGALALQAHWHDPVAAESRRCGDGPHNQTI